MKTKVLKTLVIIIMSMTMGSGIAYAQMGPVVRISETEQTIPEDIRTFVNAYFPGESMIDIDLNTMEGVYSIDLSNGYDLKFLKSGQWIEIEAPDNVLIPAELTSKLLPAESVKYLNDKGALSRIKELDFNAKFGYKVEIVKGRDRDKSYFFNNEGKTIERPKKMDKEKYF